MTCIHWLIKHLYIGKKMVSRYVSNFPLGITPANMNGQLHHVPQISLSVSMGAATTGQSHNQQQHHSQQHVQQSVKTPSNTSEYHTHKTHQSSTQQQQHQTHFRVMHSSKYKVNDLKHAVVIIIILRFTKFIGIPIRKL